MGQFAATEEAVAVREFGVVLDGALFGWVGDSGGCLGPLTHGVGVAVVHGEGVDVTAGTVPNGDEQHND